MLLSSKFSNALSTFCRQYPAPLQEKLRIYLVFESVETQFSVAMAVRQHWRFRS